MYNPKNPKYMPVPVLAELLGIEASDIKFDQYLRAGIMPFYTKWYINPTADITTAIEEMKKAYEGKKHRVYPYISDNELLELHGDAVLRLVLVEYLLIKHPGKTEEFYSRARINCEKKKTLYQFAKETRIAEYILLDKSKESFRNDIHIIEDVFEAFISGIYSAFGMEVARNFITRVLTETKVKYLENDNYKDKIFTGSGLKKSSISFCSMPYDIAKKMSNGTHKNGILIFDRRSGLCIGASTGTSEKIASMNASKQAYEYLFNNSGLCDSVKKFISIVNA